MRGKGNGKEIAHLLHGITPAYAGKSPAKISVDGYITGSPPPMRGKVRHFAGK